MVLFSCFLHIFEILPLGNEPVRLTHATHPDIAALFISFLKTRLLMEHINILIVAYTV
jgi:hypothetical protein